jgi:hypothetical protein
LAAAALALIAIGGLIVTFTALPWSQSGYLRWSAADGQ